MNRSVTQRDDVSNSKPISDTDCYSNSDSSRVRKTGTNPTSVMVHEQRDSEPEEENLVKRKKLMAQAFSVMETMTAASANTVDCTKTPVVERNNSSTTNQQQITLAADELNIPLPRNEGELVKDQQEDDISQPKEFASVSANESSELEQNDLDADESPVKRRQVEIDQEINHFSDPKKIPISDKNEEVIRRWRRWHAQVNAEKRLSDITIPRDEEAACPLDTTCSSYNGPEAVVIMDQSDSESEAENPKKRRRVTIPVSSVKVVTVATAGNMRNLAENNGPPSNPQEVMPANELNPPPPNNGQQVDVGQHELIAVSREEEAACLSDTNCSSTNNPEVIILDQSDSECEAENPKKRRRVTIPVSSVKVVTVATADNMRNLAENNGPPSNPQEVMPANELNPPPPNNGQQVDVGQHELIAVSREEEAACRSDTNCSSNNDPEVIILDQSDSECKAENPKKRRRVTIPVSSVTVVTTASADNMGNLAENNGPPSNLQEVMMPAKESNQSPPKDGQQVDVGQPEREVQIHSSGPGDFVLHKDDENRIVGYPVWRISGQGDKLQKFEYVDMGWTIIHKSVSMDIVSITWCEGEKKNFKPVKVKPLTNKYGVETIKVLPEYQPTKNITELQANDANKPQQNMADIRGEFLLHKDDEKKVKYPIWRLGADGRLQKFEYVNMGSMIIHKSQPIFTTCSRADKQNFKSIKVKALANKCGFETVKVLPEHQPASSNSP